MSEDQAKSDLANRLRNKAQRMRACLGMVYEPKWREIFIATAVLFEEAAKEIEDLNSEVFWAHMLRQDAQAQLKRLQEQAPPCPPITH